MQLYGSVPAVKKIVRDAAIHPEEWEKSPQSREGTQLPLFFTKHFHYAFFIRHFNCNIRHHNSDKPP